MVFYLPLTSFGLANDSVTFPHSKSPYQVGIFGFRRLKITHKCTHEGKSYTYTHTQVSFWTFFLSSVTSKSFSWLMFKSPLHLQSSKVVHKSKRNFPKLLGILPCFGNVIQRRYFLPSPINYRKKVSSFSSTIKNSRTFKVF